MSDLISRQDAIEAFTDFICVDYPTRELAQESAEMVMGQVPSADRTEPGRWEIKQDTDEYGLKRPKLVCSKCGKEPAAWDLTELFEFCPNCGAKMKGESHDR